MLSVAKPFRFQHFWVNHSDFIKVVSDSWGQFIEARDPITLCVRKLKRLKAKLRDWSKSTFGNLFLLLEEQQRELSILRQRDFWAANEDELSRREKELMEEINNTIKINICSFIAEKSILLAHRLGSQYCFFLSVAQGLSW